MEAVFSILISVGLGYWVDSYFETSPVGLIVGAVVGFAAFVLRLLRMSELVKKAAAEHETVPQRSVASRSADRKTILGATDRRSSDDEPASETSDANPADR